MTVFIHPQGICESKDVGAGTRVWAFAHVLPGAIVGADCNICDHVFVENDVFVGDRVTIKCGVQVWDGVRLEDDVFVGPNVTFTNDRYPRSKVRPPEFLKTKVQRGASIGANATILPGIMIGEQALVAAGSVVTRDVPARVLVQGNPATVVSFLDAEVVEASTIDLANGPHQLLAGAELHRLFRAQDARGNLIAAEFARDLPFVPQRFFAISDVPPGALRGEHAHLTGCQFIVLISGSVTILADNARVRIATKLSTPGDAMLIRPGIWSGLIGLTPASVLGVFASAAYDTADYIRDYGEFRRRFGE